MTFTDKHIIINDVIITPDNIHSHSFPDESISEFLKLWWNEDENIPLQTSGSTGIPKIISAPKKFLIASAEMTIEQFQLKESDPVLLCLSAEFIAGRMMLIRAIRGKLHVTSIPVTGIPVTSAEFKFAAMVPMQVQNLFDSGNSALLNRIDKLIIGGGEISEVLQKKLVTLKNHCYLTYGMTETFSHIAIKKLNPPEAHYTFLKGVRGWYDERSCLVIDAPSLGVHQLSTNDIVEFTDLNKFRWVGRYDNIINTGGKKISPEVLEKKLYSHLNRRFFIDKIPDDKFGQAVVLIIEGEPFDRYTAMLFDSHLKSVLEKHEVPKKICFVSRFEETPTGKIQRKQTMSQLKEM